MPHILNIVRDIRNLINAIGTPLYIKNEKPSETFKKLPKKCNTFYVNNYMKKLYYEASIAHNNSVTKFTFVNLLVGALSMYLSFIFGANIAYFI